VTTFATYSLLSESDLGSLKTYGAIMIDEWSKYPTDWVANSNLEYMVFIKNLYINFYRGATPDPVGHALYYDPVYDTTYGDKYARETLHHEYDHLIEYNYFNSYNHSDPTWLSLNPSGFQYGNGGASCYSGGCPFGEHAVQCFASGYATSGIEEDKAEVYAYLMASESHQDLKSWLPSDACLANKVNNYKQFIASHSPEMSSAYFDQINP
jgi:hypothetical protein